MKTKSMAMVMVATVALLWGLAGCNNTSAPKADATQKADTVITQPQLPTVNTADEALARLAEGNQRFVEGKNLFPNLGFDRREQEVAAQSPFATIVGCSDSRVPVEILFDQGIGDLFVIRTAGNSIEGDITMGSLDYSLEHLGVKLVVVLGHEKCGGVTGAIELIKGNHDHDANIDKLLAQVSKGIKRHQGKPAQLDEAIVDNVQYQVEVIKKSPLAKHLIEQGKLKVVGAKYNLAKGEVVYIN